MKAQSPAAAMPVLADVLDQLGLLSYRSVLEENGFGTWSTLVDITEDDLTTLQFKLGHRRALQREIATYRGVPSSLSLPVDPSSPAEYTALSTSGLETLVRQTSTPPPREKRRYKRHPKEDSNAPKRPKTGYVNFVDEQRKDPLINQLPFTQITKEVGRRWQKLAADQKCVWERDAARTRQEYERKMDVYKQTDNYRKYQVYLANFKMLQTQAAAGKRSSSNKGVSHGIADGSLASSDSFDSYSQPSSSSGNTPAELCHSSLTLAFNELVSLRGEILNQNNPPYDEQHLPSEDLLRRSTYAFIEGTGSLVFMWTHKQVDDMLDQIYRPVSDRVDPMTLAECFTVAAMGAHYDTDCCPDRIRKMLYASSTLHFHETSARQDYPRTMRLLLSMSFYALLQKHMSSRYLIAAGLQIARSVLSSTNGSSPIAVDGEGRKIFRSLTFMDSWLSYTLGYESEVTLSDIQMIQKSYTTASDDIDALVHTQTSKVGLIAAEIAKTLASPRLATRENIDALTQKLQAWHNELPPMLRMQTLIDVSCPPSITFYQRRAILMVHIMYFGALILLYRQLLVATAEGQLTDGAAPRLDLSPHDTQRYRSECAVAGQSISRLLNVISGDGTLTRRCWLIIYWAFTAAIVLLFSATTRLLDGQTDEVHRDLGYAKNCMDMLEPCRESEPIAGRYLDTLLPLYQRLRDVHQRVLGRAKTSISSLLHGNASTASLPVGVSKHEMSPISEKLSLLLIDPFGRMQELAGDGSMRRMLNEDGSCIVFWFS